MGLRISKYPDGTIRPTWWARYCRKGKQHDVDLRVPIAGTIPHTPDGNISLTVKGDAEFERSRRAAEKEFERLRKIRAETTDDMRANVYRVRTGECIDGIPLADLFNRWVSMKRQRPLSSIWRKAAKTWFSRFAAFAGAYARKRGIVCETVNDITPEIAGAWFDDIKAHYAWETVTKMMTLMRGAFRRYSTNGKVNPFADIITRGGGTDGNGKISRKPLTDAELERLFDAARGDEFVYPLIVTAACTGMRCGDVCNLKWADVDLRNGLIECKTAKTGTRVTIPIIGRLMDLLNDLSDIPGDGAEPAAYVFPAAAAKYNPRPKIGDDGQPMKDANGKIVMTDNADAVYKAVQPYFARAVMGDTEPARIAADVETRNLADVIDSARFTPTKRARVIEVYNRHKAGEKSKDIAAALGVPRSLVSMDLREAEKLTGETLRPLASIKAQGKARIDLIAHTRVSRGVGKRAASVYGWHSLRHSFIVAALDSGVPVEKVRQIVGHGECETTIANYYNPTKEHEAARIRAAMENTAIGKRTGRDGGKNIATTMPVRAEPSVDDLIAGLSKKQKQELIARLAASI